ncbi:ABC transporter permease [candidate division KSB1 bacterium]|nr:ABC transporter permease [candidate division KSB1 bacterium]
MFKNYLKLAYRHFRKHKAYSFINVFGLALGMACCILMLLYVQDELSYDEFHNNAERIFRVVCDEKNEGQIRRLASTFAPLTPPLLAEFPEIERVVRLFPYNATVALGAEKRFQENRFLFADSTVFEVFSFAFLQGDPRTALREPNALVVTAATAQKYFGDENPLGKILAVEQRDFKITGVLKDVPHNSHFDFDFLASFNSVNAIMGTWVLQRGWYWPPMYTYVMLPSAAAAPAIESRLPEFSRKHLHANLALRQTLHLQPLMDIHLHSDLEGEIAPTGNIAYVYIFSAIAAFILLIACINFMNLATARSANRAREVGLRKVVGAQKPQLMKQFLGESFFYAVLALLLALTLVELFLPVFNTLVGKQVEMRYAGNWVVAVGLLALTLIVGMMAGSYPAFFLASFRPLQVLQGKILTGSGGRSPLRIRAVLVVAQFIISIGLIAVTMIVHAQLRFIQEKRLGFDKERLVVIPIRDEVVQQNFSAVKNSLLAQTGVAQVSAISNFPWEQGYYDFFIHAEGMSPETKLNMPTLLVEQDFIRVLDMQIVAGRDFAKEHSTDAQEAFILNEAAVKKLGWESALDKKIKMESVAAGKPREGRVIGVVKDFHLRSLHYEIEPLVLLISPEPYYLDNIVIRLGTENISQTLASLGRTWREIAPHRPFEYFFLDEQFDRLYRKEQKLAQIFNYFSAMAILVGCLGLFGLASFVAEQKTKEIGIRKVLGASVASIVLLLSKEFTKLVFVATLVAWPLAYFAMSRWLQDFAYRIDLSFWIFLLAGAIALLIAWLTVSWQAVKAALANPVEALRYE